MTESDSEDLTPRQLSVLELLLSGKGVKETADILHLHRSTVSYYLNKDPVFKARYNSEIKDAQERIKAGTRSLLDEALNAAREFVDRRDPRMVERIIGLLPKPLILSAMTENEPTHPNDALMDMWESRDMRMRRESGVDPRELDQMKFDAREHEGLATPRTERLAVLDEAFDQIGYGFPFQEVDGSPEQQVAKVTNLVISSFHVALKAYAAAHVAEVLPSDIVERRRQMFLEHFNQTYGLPVVEEDDPINLEQLREHVLLLGPIVHNFGAVVQDSQRIGRVTGAEKAVADRARFEATLERFTRSEERSAPLLKEVLEQLALVLAGAILMERSRPPAPPKLREVVADADLPEWLVPSGKSEK